MDINIIKNLVSSALIEDLGSTVIDCSLDITTQSLSLRGSSKARIISRASGVLCGSLFVNEVFAVLGVTDIVWHFAEGDLVAKNSVLCEISGESQKLLVGERTALNFLQMLSGVATKTKSYVDALKDSSIKILDTRKTIPSLRKLQKYAVATAGGMNHRFGLYDAFLIKENHIRACGGIQKAIELARAFDSSKSVEVEVESIEEFKQAQTAKADIALLDNFSVAAIKEVIAINNSALKLEVSGNICLNNINKYSGLDIDFISVGDLTKNLDSLDLSMLFDI